MFDDENLVSSAGLVPVMALAEQTGLPDMLSERVVFRSERIRSGAANPAPKLTAVIPRWLSAWGIGGVVLMIAAVLLIFGVITPLSPVQVALAVPIGLQEMVLAVWLITKGFGRSVLMRQQS